MTTTTSSHGPPAPRGLALASVALFAVAALVGCGSGHSSTDGSGGSKANADATIAPPRSSRPASSSYTPKIVPSEFSATIDNPYFTLRPGQVAIAKGFKDGVPETHTTVVTGRTKMIAGVRTRVVHDDVTTTGGQLVEKVSDWYAQDREGNVWYFGEATADYENGAVVSTQGSWEAGVDGAKPGIVMPAHPRPGPAFYSEFRPGVAEDRAQVLRTDAALRIPKYGRFTHVVEIRDTNPLDPGMVSHKWYAHGVGQLRTIRVGSSHKESSTLVSRRP
jgi:hypothetical protein